ncbi:MAG: hypothetical protein L0229_20375 [Blastocatellia bacterium]|nr:hypothetical protein [Blastocatellia bacterium]
MKIDRRYQDYGRKGAIIITGQTLYQIDEYGSERGWEPRRPTGCGRAI